MIKQKEIRNKAIEWKVSADTVDKDYVLGHFLSGFFYHFNAQLIFKGGTCLRKCYFPNYRFSEDLDFSAIENSFVLKSDDLNDICRKVEAFSGIQFSPETIEPLKHEDQLKGYQVYIKYWGANHSRNQLPLPPERWQTRIKLEISTAEVLLCEPSIRTIHHPYSDQLFSEKQIQTYTIEEIVAEKLRALKQRSYTAPRDFYDLYYLTNNFNAKEWQIIKKLFIGKMKYKKMIYGGPDSLFKTSSIQQTEKQWKRSLQHQVSSKESVNADLIIKSVIDRIFKYL